MTWINSCLFQKNGVSKLWKSSGWGSVGRAVASDTRGPVIGKSLFIYWTFVYCQLCIENTKIKKKETGNGPFLKKQLWKRLKYIINKRMVERVNGSGWKWTRKSQTWRRAGQHVWHSIGMRRNKYRFTTVKKRTCLTHLKNIKMYTWQENEFQVHWWCTHSMSKRNCMIKVVVVACGWAHSWTL